MMKVADMKTMKILSVAALALGGFTGCGAEPESERPVQAVEATPKQVQTGVQIEDDRQGATVTPGAPYRINYKIIGTPVIGAPVTVDLTVSSLDGARPVDLSYRFKVSSALLFAEAQPEKIRMEATVNEKEFRQQVTMIPQREGRFYLNVSASFEIDQGTQSTIVAIPIQVGTGSRELTPNGEVQADENGESIRVLTNE